MHQRNPALDRSPPASAAFTLVEAPGRLRGLLGALGEAPRVALDTEADSFHHYREKLCLIQLTVDGEHWVVDPLVEELDLEPLVRRLEVCPLILHGSDYDLRLIHRTYGFRPARVFDTMLAAQLLGWPEIGLAALVERVIGIGLSKHGQMADWSRRPLPAKLLTYAVDDTRYLHAVAKALSEDLKARGRLGWLEESCERQLAAACDGAAEPPLAAESDEAWRIKGGRHFQGRSGAMLRELWQWREAIARRSDRPPFRVAPNKLLLDWARWIDQSPEAEASQMPEKPAWLRGRRAQGFDLAVERALELPPAKWPKRPERNHGAMRFSTAEETVLKSLLRARDARAEELGIGPGVLGPREALKALVRPRPSDEAGLRRHGGLMRWQSRCLGPVLLPILAKALGDGDTIWNG